MHLPLFLPSLPLARFPKAGSTSPSSLVVNIPSEVDEFVPVLVLAAYLKLRKIKHSLKHFFSYKHILDFI